MKKFISDTVALICVACLAVVGVALILICQAWFWLAVIAITIIKLL